MPTVNFILHDGTRRAVAGSAGDSVMQIATGLDLPGIEAICGGFCNCATCHVYVGAVWLDKLPALLTEEDEMLDGTAAARLSNSRLACQIRLDEVLDGIEIMMPERQA